MTPGRLPGMRVPAGPALPGSNPRPGARPFIIAPAGGSATGVSQLRAAGHRRMASRAALAVAFPAVTSTQSEREAH